MSKIAPLPSPLYKPAVYAELCQRADITLFVALQNDIKLSPSCLTLSPNLATFFGLIIEDGQIFLGVPDAIWALLKSIDFHSFSVERNHLCLHYKVDTETTNQVRTATGFESRMELSSCDLVIQIPVRPPNATAIKKHVVLHLIHMDEHQHAITGKAHKRSISKKLNTEVFNDEQH